MRNYLIVLAGCFLLFGACKKENDGKTNDPLIGNWKLRVVTSGGQSVDVTDRECFRNSYVNVNTSTYTLYLSLPNGEQCVSETVSAEWLIRDGRYYVVSNGVEEDAGVKLLDNNETLQMTINADNGAYIFSFRK